jgi:hypothetical protein
MKFCSEKDVHRSAFKVKTCFSEQWLFHASPGAPQGACGTVSQTSDNQQCSESVSVSGLAIEFGSR